MAALQTPHWSRSTVHVADTEFQNTAQTVDDVVKLGKPSHNTEMFDKLAASMDATLRRQMLIKSHMDIFITVVACLTWIHSAVRVATVLDDIENVRLVHSGEVG